MQQCNRLICNAMGLEILDHTDKVHRSSSLFSLSFCRSKLKDEQEEIVFAR